jgi:hypothetical protein
MMGAQPVRGAAPSSGVDWIYRKVAALRAAREFLERAGLPPVSASGNRDFYRPGGKWKLPGWVGCFDDAELLAFAEERGFRHAD